MKAKITVTQLIETEKSPGVIVLTPDTVFEQTLEDFNLSRFVSDLNKPKRRRPASKPSAS